MKKIFTLLFALTAIISSATFAQCNPEFNFTVNGGTNTVQFLPVTTASVQHNWLFGDGTSSNNIAPSHVYAPGGYNVVHVVTYRSPNDSNIVECIDSAVRWVTVTGQAPCDIHASFSFIRDSVQTNTVYFTDLSTGSNPNTVHFWSFGDGTSSYVQNPVHAYQSSGLYTVCLTVRRDNLCADDSCTLVQVQVPTTNCNLTVNYTSTPDSVHSNIIHFANLSTPLSSADSVTWIFGDGSVSHDPLNVTHTYTQGGVFNVCLVVKKNSNNGTVPCVREFCQNIIVDTPQNACNLTAYFDYRTDSALYNKIHFINYSTPLASNDSIRWTFGDGSSSTDVNPVHTYNVAGTYTVCLRVKRTQTPGSAPCVREYCTTVVVQQAVPCNLHAGFSFARDSVQTNKVYFTNLSTGTATNTIFWSFGDGTYSSDQNPVHIYQASGAYTVCVTIRRDSLCADDTCKTVQVQVPANPCNLVVNYTAAIDSLHTNVIHFVNTSTPFLTTDSVTWYFGDGSISHDPLNVTHTYTQGGVFNVCLVVKRNSNNGTVPCVREFCHSIIVDTPQTACNLVAYFSNRADSMFPNKIYFTNLSSPLANTDSIRWTFGDGTSSTDVSPVHSYNQAGNYTVCLRVKKTQTSGTAPCVSEYCRTITVTPATTCNLVVDFSYTADSISGGSPAVYHFTNTSTPLSNADSSFWNFGDGSPLVINPNAPVTHTYAAPGTYVACLLVKKVIPGTIVIVCERQVCKTIVVTGPSTVCDQLQANFSWNADPVNNRKINFHNLSSPVTANTFPTWSFGDGTSGTGWNADHVYAQPGTYLACLTIRMGTTCVRDTCRTVVVLPSTVDSCNIQPGFITHLDSLNRRKVYFTNTTVASSSATYAVWSFGDGTSGTGWNADHVYTMPGWYAVCLSVTQGNMCTRTYCDSVFVPGNVLPPVNCDSFHLQFGYRRDAYMPNKLFFFATGNAPLYAQQWTFTGVNDSAAVTVNQNNPVYVFPDTGVYRVCVKGFFSTNCVKEYCDEVRIYNTTVPSQCVLVSYPNPAHDYVMFNVQLDAPGLIAATIFNSQGVAQMQYTQTGVTGNNLVSLGVQNLVPGFYTVRVMYNGRVCYTRFQKI